MRDTHLRPVRNRFRACLNLCLCQATSRLNKFKPWFFGTKHRQRPISITALEVPWEAQRVACYYLERDGLVDIMVPTLIDQRSGHIESVAPGCEPKRLQRHAANVSARQLWECYSVEV